MKRCAANLWSFRAAQLDTLDKTMDPFPFVLGSSFEFYCYPLVIGAAPANAQGFRPCMSVAVERRRLLMMLRPLSNKRCMNFSTSSGVYVDGR